MKMFNESKIMHLGLLLAAAAVLAASCKPAPSEEKVRAMMQIEDVRTMWVEKEYQAWPPKLVLVPAISFKVRNLTAEPLTYVNFNGVFRFKDDVENLGDNYLAAIRGEPVAPGELSPEITLKSNFGVEGKSLASFQNNPMWRLVEVKVFAQMRGSKHVLMGTYAVSRTIDFEEPEPVGQPEE